MDDSLWLSLTSFLPNFIGTRLSDGLEGQETLVKAMNEYFVSGSHAYGSPLVNAHYPLFAGQLDHSEVARFETANGLGALANTAPTAFWTIFHIFSNAALLEDIRSQVESITTTEKLPDTGKITQKIYLGKLRDVPVLYSAVEELSRYRATGIGVRMVMEDTTVGEDKDLYHLKKGSVLIIANEAIHSDKTV